MRLIQAIWPARVQRVLAGLYALLGAVACFVPLFNAIGYESAALFAVVGGFGAVFSTQFLLGQSRLINAADSSPVARFFDIYLRHLAAFIAPLILLTLNGVRVETCDPTAGYLFWLVLVLPSLAVGQTIAMVAVAIGGSRGWLRRLVSTVIIVVSIAWFAAHLALEPPITGFQLFLGYFSGSIYDEALAVPSSLVIYRLMCLLGVVGALAWLEAIWRMRTFSRVIPAIVVAMVAWGALGALWVQRTEFGIDITRDVIQEQLGGMVETEHFVIYFPATRRFRKMADQLKDDHEFRYHEMTTFFEIDPVALSGQKIKSYVYPNREVKGRLMGGRRTLVAKLWLGEMHILWRRAGDHLLAHELAHIFTEPIGTGPLRLSTRWGVGINMGLVEGIATAADWPVVHMTPHEATAALLRGENPPNIRGLIGASGFWRQSSGRAYTLVGSFIRYLRDTYGIQKIRDAYGHGEFGRVYGRSVDDLVTEWEAFIQTVTLTPQEEARARFIFDRPSIFQKKCARVIAEWRREAAVAQNSQRVEQADILYRKILSYDPNPRYLLEYADFLLENQRYDEAERAARIVVTGDYGRSFEAQGRQQLADVLWVKGDEAGARGEYASCLNLGVPLDVQRLVTVKLGALGKEPDARGLGLDYLIRESDSDVSLFFPAEWVRTHPNDAIANYLLGRRLWAASEFEPALGTLRRAYVGIPEILRLELNLMVGQALYWLGRLDEADKVFERLSAISTNSSPYLERAREWRERTRWRLARNRVEAP